MKLPGFECDFFKNGLGYSKWVLCAVCCVLSFLTPIHSSLKAHTGCVNAVSYSKTNGSRWVDGVAGCSYAYSYSSTQTHGHRRRLHEYLYMGFIQGYRRRNPHRRI